VGGFVRVVEVGPRDGLQNEIVVLSTEQKLTFIAALQDAGCTEIEVASFVNPKLVPAMADASEVVRGISSPPAPSNGGDDVVFWCLVPNERGYVRAREAGARAIAVFAAASESFSQKNIGRSVESSLDEYEKVVSQARSEGCQVRGYVSTVTHCPYEGKIAPDAVLAVAEKLFAMGCEEVSLGETLGRATPDDISRLLEILLPTLPVEKLAGHFHDTSGRALENVAVALDFGLRTFDSSAAGLGGCPFAPGAAGNVATESLVQFLHAQGYETGIDSEKIFAAGVWIREILREAAV
jgi:hydroxymethylglutaryl-CoA lyase